VYVLLLTLLVRPVFAVSAVDAAPCTPCSIALSSAAVIVSPVVQVFGV
jgi:hypothetical protein